MSAVFDALEQEAIKEDFQEAVEFCGTQPVQLKEEVQRRLFGLHCFATRGAAPADAPTDADAMEQYLAWQEAASVGSAAAAMQEYVDLVRRDCPRFQCEDASDGLMMNLTRTFAIVPAVAAAVARGVKSRAKRVDAELSKHKGLAPGVYAGIAGFLVGKLPAPIGNGERRY